MGEGTADFFARQPSCWRSYGFVILQLLFLANLASFSPWFSWASCKLNKSWLYGDVVQMADTFELESKFCRFKSCHLYYLVYPMVFNDIILFIYKNRWYYNHSLNWRQSVEKTFSFFTSLLSFLEAQIIFIYKDLNFLSCSRQSSYAYIQIGNRLTS